MFVPDMDTDPHQPWANQDVTAPKVINRDNTRLEQYDAGPSRRASEPPSPTRSRIDAAIAGKPCEFTYVYSEP
jgi:protein DGCR14